MNSARWTSLLQFSDGLFPTGAYAHSFGLEWYVQAARVGDAAALETLVHSCLEAAVAPTDAVALSCAWKAARGADLDLCLRLDEMLDALKPAEELRAASRQMGRQTLRVAGALIAQDPPIGRGPRGPEENLMRRFASAVEQGTASGNHPVALGIVGGALEWEPRQMIAAYLYSFGAVMVNSALRLFPLGQLAGQRVLWNLQPLFGELAGEALEKSEEEMWSFAPAMEIASMRHRTLEARLFRS